MKKLLATFFALIFVFSFAGCSGKNNQIGNQVSGPDAFKEYAITLDAPESAQNKSYYLYEEKGDNNETVQIAEVKYEYNSVKCTLRCANVKNQNISGIEESGDPNILDLLLEGYSSQIRIYTLSSNSVALWTLGNYSYSILAETTDAQTMTACAYDAASLNVPASGGEEETESVSE